MSPFTMVSTYLPTAIVGLWGECVSISGKAELTNDRSKVGKYYSPTLKAWLGDLGDDGSENYLV